MGEAAEILTSPVHWSPQPRQWSLITCPVFDVLFGGARGGGKSDGLLGDWLAHQAAYGRHCRGILVRRSMPQMEELKARSREIYASTGAAWKEQRSTWLFPNGSTLKFRYLERDSDAEEYQGHSYTWLGVDEIGSFPRPDPIDKLKATLRSANGIPCFQRSTANPGGAGHNWLKARYVDPAPPFTPFVGCAFCGIRYVDDVSAACECQPSVGVQRVFIPSLLRDNPRLTENDPHYAARIMASGSPTLVKAWLEGDWNIEAGLFFDDLFAGDKAKKIIIPQFRIPAEWSVSRGYDDGSTRPWAYLMFAESNGEAVMTDEGERCWPRGTIFVIGEEYGYTGKANEGIRAGNAEIGRRIVAREKLLREGLEIKSRIRSGPADGIWSTNDGRCIANDFASLGLSFVQAAKGPGSRAQGWQLMRTRLMASLAEPMREPGLLIFDSCRNLIRTLPSLPRDEKKPDDVDSSSEDHLADVVRYRLLKPKGGGTSHVGFGG